MRIRVSSTVGVWMEWGSVYLGGLAGTIISRQLCGVAPWFGAGWHVYLAYLISGIISTVFIIIPLFWLKRRYLKVEERRCGDR